ncbi:rRNA binding protein [Aureococcus anophagefferens]|nr:rRNA binding protein [Aureococcus anophagefferens]
MKTINGTKFLDIPEGVEVTCKSRKVSVKGPRGELTRTFKHVQLEMEMTTNAAGAPQLKIQLWFGTRKQIATIRTIYSHVENMVIGVTQGFCYKMRFVYSHFPINAAQRPSVEIRNFLGDKLVRKVKLLDGVDYVRTADSCDIKHKDLRKFLDGIFVSQKGPIPKED